MRQQHHQGSGSSLGVATYPSSGSQSKLHDHHEMGIKPKTQSLSGQSLSGSDSARSGALTGARKLLEKIKYKSIDKVWRMVLEGALMEARTGDIRMARKILRYLIVHVPWYEPLYQEALRLEEKAERPRSAIKIIEQGLAENPRYGPLWFGAFKNREIMDVKKWLDEVTVWLHEQSHAQIDSKSIIDVQRRCLSIGQDLLRDPGSYACVLGAATAFTAQLDDRFKATGLGTCIRTLWSITGGATLTIRGDHAVSGGEEAMDVKQCGQDPDYTDRIGCPMQEGLAAVNPPSLMNALEESSLEGSSEVQAESDQESLLTKAFAKSLQAPALDVPLVNTRRTFSDAQSAISKELIWKVHFEAALMEQRAAALDHHQLIGDYIKALRAKPDLLGLQADIAHEGSHSKGGAAAEDGSHESSFANTDGGMQHARRQFASAVLACPANLRWKVWLAGARMELCLPDHHGKGHGVYVFMCVGVCGGGGMSVTMLSKVFAIGCTTLMHADM